MSSDPSRRDRSRAIAIARPVPTGWNPAHVVTLAFLLAALLILNGLS